MNKVKIGVIGLGQRRVELLSTMLFCEEADIVAMGGAPQPVPDFARGEWVCRKSKDVVNLTK